MSWPTKIIPFHKPAPTPHRDEPSFDAAAFPRLRKEQDRHPSASTGSIVSGFAILPLAGK